MMRGGNSRATLADPMPRINQQALKTELAKRGFESVSIKRELPGGRIEVEANNYAPVPVAFSVTVDAGGRVKSIEGDSPSPAGVADAGRYVKTLRESGQLAAAGEGAPARGVTHQIERDAQGRHVLRRKRFSIS